MTATEPTAGSAPVPPADYLAVVAQSLRTIAAADASVPVQLGPGDRVGDVQRWAAQFAAAVTDQLSSVGLAARPPLPQPADLATAEPALIDALSQVPPTRPCWTPSPAVAPQAGFWLRCSAQALSVRAWQVQVAADAPAPLPEWLLRDGIDEHLTVLLAVSCADPQTPTGRARGTITVSCTDVDARWTVRLDPGCVPSLAAETAAPEAELAADAATLRLGLAGMLALPAGAGEPGLLAALCLR